MNESLSDKVISVLGMAKDLDEMLDGVNDYGDATGYREEQDQIMNDFHASLGSISSRISTLRRRVRMNKSQTSE